mgnify:CR=1 FL=1
MYGSIDIHNVLWRFRNPVGIRQACNSAVRPARKPWSSDDGRTDGAVLPFRAFMGLGGEFPYGFCNQFYGCSVGILHSQSQETGSEEQYRSDA